MKSLFTRILLATGVIIMGSSLLTGCNTVQGTVTGAGKDLKAAADAVNPPKHRVKRHTVTKTPTATTETTTTTHQDANQQTTTTTEQTTMTPAQQNAPAPQTSQTTETTTTTTH